MKKFSQFMKLNFRDVLKSLEVVLIGTVIPAITLVVNNQRLPTLDDVKSVLWMAGAAWLTYITKNWLTNSDDEFLKTEKSEGGENAQ